jgi:hypothetical protein
MTDAPRRSAASAKAHIGICSASPMVEFRLSGFRDPLFKIQFRKIGEENPLDLQGAETIENTTLQACRRDLYDLLSKEYEVWIRDPSGEPLSNKAEKYIIDFQAQNVLEDGYPLIVRKLHNSVVFQLNRNVEPFEIDAYTFFRGHVPKGELLEAFEPRTARLFESILNKKKS